MSEHITRAPCETLWGHLCTEYT